MKNTRTLKEMIYSLESLAYYFNIKPQEFWNSTYREMYLYCEMQFVKTMEDFKQEIILQEAVTNKMIQADSMNKKPKVISIQSMFKELFKK